MTISQANAVLSSAWFQALVGLNINPESALSKRVLTDLLRCYAEPHRHWHSAQHIAQVLEAIEAWVVPQPAPELLLAALFHDAIYCPGKPSNEARSAALAAAQLRSLGAAEDAVSRVCHLVLATMGSSRPPDQETALLLDADRAVLGAERDDYRRYARAIQAEHSDLAPIRYQAGRSRFLLRTLFSTIYHSPQGRRLSWRARRNLIGELWKMPWTACHRRTPPLRQQFLLSTGTACELIEPRHWIRGYQVLVCESGTVEPAPRELEELAALATREARRKAREVLGSADHYLLIQSGSSVRRRQHYHCHLIPLRNRLGKACVYLILSIKNFARGFVPASK